MLKIKDLHVEVDGKEILSGLNLEIGPGEVHAVMGPNGAGKSTLSRVLAGHPSYQVTKGEILYDINFEYQSLLDIPPDVRAKEGIFLAFQYPVEVPGVSNRTLLKESLNAVLKHQGSAELNDEAFEKLLARKLELVGMSPDFLDRSVNTGFSGGEKKRNEILQMAILSPRLTILDEIDSGLDIDALRSVAQSINKLRSSSTAVLAITHYQRLLNYLEPDFVHVLAGGRIVESGDKSLALKLEEQGYDWAVSRAAP